MNIVGELLSEEVTAAAIGVEPRTLTAWRHYGRGPAYLKVGKRVVYRPGDIQAWLETRLIDPSRRKEAAA